MNQILGKWPGVVKTYDGATRIATVEVPGITDGSTDLPEAVFCYDIGDRSTSDNAKEPTEILVKPGDLVWIEFEAGDPRFPIIVGYRTPRQGNSTGWRRMHHANMELTADGKFIVNCTDFIVNSTTSTINGQTTVNGQTAINGNTAVAGTLQNNDANVGSTHVHDDPQGGQVGTPH